MNSKLRTLGIVLVLLTAIIGGCDTAIVEPTTEPVTPASRATKEISTQVPETVPTQTQTVNETDHTDTAKDDLLIREALAAHLGAKVNELTIVINENTGSHARGGVENGYFLAAKMDDQWLIVADGQGALDCQGLAPYGFPSSMLPECQNTNGVDRVKFKPRVLDYPQDQQSRYLLFARDRDIRRCAF